MRLHRKKFPLLRLLPFLLIPLLAGWLVYASLFPSLPSSRNSSLYFYANELKDDLKQVILQALRKAKVSICLQIYSLTDPQVVALLVKKQQEGVNVCILYDPKASATLPSCLKLYPIETSALMHRKILIVDHAFVFLSTANFTSASLKMHHNLIVALHNTSLATFFEKGILAHSSFSQGSSTLTCHLLPEGGKEALKELLLLIENAKARIDLALFTLTHPRIIEALLSAKKRGVEISLAIDYYTSLGASAKALEILQNNQIPVFRGGQSELLHYKCALFDQEILVMGSANWTQAAFEKNQDFMVILSSLSKSEKSRLIRLFKEIAKAAEKL